MATTPDARSRTSLFAVLLTGAVLTAQTDEETSKGFRTKDSSEFLLVHVPTRMVHWIQLQPALRADVPVGYEGLDVALARASLLGPAEPSLANEDSLAWEKALRRAPSSGAQIVEIPGRVGVSVSFPPSSLARVATLMRLRVERRELLQVPEHFARARRERLQRLLATPNLAMLREVLSACEPGRSYVKALDAGKPGPLTEEFALDFYQSRYHPEGTINVLVGGFDLTTAERTLSHAFDTPRKRVSLPEAGPAPRAQGRPQEPNSEKSSEAIDTVFVACPMPAGDPFDLEVLLEILAGDADAVLPGLLRAAGHPDIWIRKRAPFPEKGGVLLMEFTATTKQATPLSRDVEEALDKAAKLALTGQQVADAIAATRARRAKDLADPARLALLLARRWNDRGEAPRGKLLVDPTVSPLELSLLAGKVLAATSRTVVKNR